MRNGSWAKNSRCWSGMKSRITLRPGLLEPAADAGALLQRPCSPGWKGEVSGDVARSDLTLLVMLLVLRWLRGT